MIDKLEILDQNLHFGPYIMSCRLPKYIIDNLIAGGEVMDNDFRNNLACHLKLEKAYNEEQTKWFAEEMTPVFNEYRRRHCSYHRIDLQNDVMPKVDMAMESLWINYMMKGEVNPPHIHTGDLSFVIYCQVPENMTTDVDGAITNKSAPPGSIIFQYGENSRPQWNTSEIYFTPTAGDCFVFPALLTHLVLPFRCEGIRISVSGNLTYTNRHEWPENFF